MYRYSNSPGPQASSPPDENPFGDTPYGLASPVSNRPSSLAASSTTAFRQLQLTQRYFHSRRVRKGEIEKPWMIKRDPKEKWVTIIPVLGVVVGLAVAGFLIWDGVRSVVNHKYCSVFFDDFSSGALNPDIWTREIECGGFGNGQFDMTTNLDENAYIRNAQLILQPTLQEAKLIENEGVMNLTEKKLCTGDGDKACVAKTNFTSGQIINPVKSARLNTKKKGTIRYGRVEVRAKLPEGDWLWPAIWMMPVDSAYGPWPASGEIDIMESRGNNHTYVLGGNNVVASTLHWGPTSSFDSYWRTTQKRTSLHTSYAKDFHTFGVEWSEKYLFTYVDSRLLQVLYTNFKQPLWQRGKYPLSTANGTRIQDPWSYTGDASTPFDREFYLIINLAVGGTNGWFKDGENGKPWDDNDHAAAKQFWDSRETWQKTWKNSGAMVIDSVKMWKQCD